MSIKESALNIISNLAQNDYIRAVTNSGNSRRVRVSELAKSVVEDYTGSSLAGENQSVQGAFSALETEILNILPTDTASGEIASFPDGSDLFPALAVVAGIEPVQSGSGTPSPTNVRPISGHTEVNVVRTGKNLAQFRAINTTWSGITMRTNGSSIAISGTATANVAPWTGEAVSTYETMKNGPFPAGTYTISCRGFEMQAVQDRITAQAKYADGSSVSGINSARITPSTVGGSPNDTTFTATKPFKMDFWLNIQQGSVCDFTATIQLEKGSTTTDYEPYTEQSYTTPLGRTVYGGTLDVVSGVLTVDYGKAVWNVAQNVISAGTNTYRVYDANIKGGTFIDDNNVICNMLEQSANAVSGEPTFRVSGSEGNHNIYVFNANLIDTSIVDAASFKTWLASKNLEFIYPLATTQTYQLTPQQVDLFKGYNSVWGDAGDMSVTYKADIQRYIDKQTNELRAAILALS